MKTARGSEWALNLLPALHLPLATSTAPLGRTQMAPQPQSDASVKIFVAHPSQQGREDEGAFAQTRSTRR